MEKSSGSLKNEYLRNGWPGTCPLSAQLDSSRTSLRILAVCPQIFAAYEKEGGP